MERTARYIAQLALGSSWIRHGMFWLSFISFNLISSFAFLDTTDKWLHFGGSLLIHVFVVYSTYGMYILAKKQDSIIIFVVSLFLLPLVGSELACRWWLAFHPADTHVTVWNYYSFFVFFATLTATLKFGKDLYVWQQEEFLRKQEQAESEVNFLKAQISPHFLFNTLNNLYGHAVTKSDQLPDMMLRLSDLLRYTIYDTGKPLVPLHDELDYIHNYIELEKIRLSKTADVQITLPENVSPELQVAPLILICFVENAFKHSRHTVNGRVHIKGKITIENDSLLMEIENSYNPEVESAGLSKRDSGVGLENVRKRLALVYPEKHWLNATAENGIYHLKLSLKL